MTLRLAALMLILATNGFFAAAEVSLVSVRQSRLRELAEQGVAGAQTALNLLSNPGRLLSVTQVGVTLASLGLGWAGEDTVYQLLLSLVKGLFPVPGVVLHGVAFAIAFLAISYAHVIVGEVVPKNLAIEKSDRVALIAAPILSVFYSISAPFVIVVERSSAFILRALRLRDGHARGGHSIEELKYIIESSREEGHMDQFTRDAIEHLIELSDHSVREIMTPRPNIVSIPIDADVEHVLNIMAENKYTRVPVYEDRPEQIIGIVHYKDLMRVLEERRFAHEQRRAMRPFRLKRFIRKAPVVPETKPLNQLIDEFRMGHSHMALVVDEFGTIVGLVTLEDVLEQVFGDIGDEHDAIRPVKPGREEVLELDGTTTIRELETRYDIELPSEAGFETLAGFLLYRFGFIPKVGESVEQGSRRFTVMALEKNRIAMVRIERVEAPAAEGTPEHLEADSAG
jgi:putative hemolysin